MNRNIISTVIVSGAAALLAACSHSPPPELVDARQTYLRVSRSPTASIVPAEVHKAQEALIVAEDVFERHPTEKKSRHFAYVAQRKALLAEALGNKELERRKRIEAERQFHIAQAQLLEQQRRDISDKDAELQRAAEALKKLAKVKEEKRGTVVTLSGSVLFPSGQATLLPTAKERLQDVVDALKATKDRKLIIEGHTDSRGTDQYNMGLAQRRAEAVRNFIVNAGYDPDLIVAEGVGEGRPVSNNKSAEGRANNRRVEMIIKDKGD